MTDRDLIGEKVISQNYGEGEIINVFPEKVEIKFVSKTSQFIWKAFTMSLKAVRPEIQEYLEEKSMVLITFSVGEYGIGPVPEDVQISTGEILKLPKVPEGQPDYIFKGWSDGNNTYSPGSEYIAKTNTKFYAKWEKKTSTGGGPGPGPGPFHDAPPRIYFVFQGSTYEKELSEGFIFAPYSRLDRWIHHWERMNEVRRGDIILHCVNTEVLAVSQALGSEYQIDMPRWADQWRQYGPKARRINIEVHEVLHSVSTKNYIHKNKEYCRDEKNPPFNKNGTGNQGYLFNCPKRLAAMYLTLLAGKNPELKRVPFIESMLQLMEWGPEYQFIF